MPTRLYLLYWTILAVLFAPAPALVPVAWAAPKYKVLHAFAAGKDGATLWGSLTLDAKGSVYGTTAGGGTYGYGTVFELTPKSSGRWAEAILYNFHNPYKTNDGGEPSASLILDAAGNLYGTTPVGGGNYKYGTVFELSPGTDGWKETVIHRFGLHSKAGSPYAGVIMDTAGDLYGVGGSAYELSPSSDGKWREHIMHTFPSFRNDGSGPFAGLIMDAVGNLYGTTEMGGSNRCGGGCGTAYQLQRMPDGKWKESILHTFDAHSGDGAFPGVGALVLDSAGSLYGTTDVGGATGYGTVFRLTQKANGGWKETILHSFAGDSNGGYVSAGVVMDKAGNLYGTTIGGGDSNCDCGVVYKLAPGNNGQWTYTVLHTFIGSDGAQPDANLILDDKGNLYGTTATGGPGGYGVAFELTP